ncbi:MAG: hypothetical protein JWN01_450 [Patescibacteria group bacterium]|nr:hypothetical protein [Patescibacteria group bacterium]
MTPLALIWAKHKHRIIVFTGLAVMLAGAVWLLRGHPTEPIDSYAACARAGYPIMESEPPACVAKGHTYVGPRGSPVPISEPGVSQEFQLLVEGDSRGAYPQRQEIITSQAQWERYWAAVHANIKPLPPLLPVDFTTSNVIALSEGPRATGGYNLKVTGIITSPAGTAVDVTEQISGAKCIVTQKVTDRYYIVRTARLPAPISFRASKETRDCP